MIHLHLSNRFEALAAALAARVRGQREAAGAFGFEPVHVLAPDRGVRLAVHLELARRLGISANLTFVSIGELPLLALEPAERARTRVASAWALQRLLLDALAPGPLLDDPALAPVARYLRHGVVGDVGDDGLDRDALDRRRAQLAGRLAARFAEYGLSRPDLLAAWRTTTTLPAEHALAETERWQRRLWLEVARRLEASRPEAAEGAEGAEGAARWALEADLIERARAAPVAADAPPALHVVGFAHLEPLRVAALAALARAADVHVYALVPCDPGDGGCAPFEPRDAHPGLERWGRVALEQVALWREAARAAGVACAAHPAFDDDAAPASTLLGRLQRSLAARDAWRASSPASADASLVVMACPDPWREVEVAADQVWRAIDEAAAAGRTLRFSDVALVLAGPDPDRYRGAIATVFRQAHRIPVSFADGPPGDTQRVVEAARLLVQLPLGEFTRDELLRLITHPAIVEAPGEVALRPDDRRTRRRDDVERWLAWSEALMIVRGADRDDHAGTYLERDLLSWDQGLRRLALGALMTGARGRDARPVTLGDDDYAPLDLDHDELDPAARLTLLVRSLLADARFARGAPQPLGVWAELMARLVQSYVVPGDEGEAELKGRCAHALRALADLDEVAAAPSPVSYRVAAELGLRLLDELRPRAHDLADGVVVTALRAGRPMPARLVIVLGLDERHVPRPVVHDDLDLRRVERRPGDADAGDLDAAAFLERVLAARERLVLSYVARDAQTGQRLAPSSLVRELEHALEEAGLLPGAREALTVHHPLRRHDRAYFDGARPALRPLLPAARREARARALRDDLEAHLRRALPAGFAWPSPTELRRALAPSVRAQVAALLDDAPPPPPAPASPAAAPDALRVSIGALARFLESPLQGWAAHRLRLARDDDADLLAREDEPFACDALGSSALLRAAFGAALLAAGRGEGALGDLVEPAYDDVVRAAELDGRAPTGVFLDKVRDEHAGVLACWAQALDELELAPGALRPERFGPSWDDDAGPPPLDREPLRVRARLPLGERDVLVTGRTQIIDPDPDGPTLVRLVQGAPGPRHLPRVLVEALVLAAAGLLPDAGLRLAVVGGEGGLTRLVFAPPGADAARAHLALLLGDLLSGSHDHLLAGDAALEWVRQTLELEDDPRAKAPAPLAEQLRATRDDPRRATADQFGPVRRADRLEPPADAEARARRRFEPLVRWTRQGADP